MIFHGRSLFLHPFASYDDDPYLYYSEWLDNGSSFYLHTSFDTVLLDENPQRLPESFIYNLVMTECYY